MKYIYLLRGCQQVEHEEYNDTHQNKTQTDTNQGNRILTSPSLISISVSSLNNTIISVSVFYCLYFPTKPQFIFVCQINKVLSLNSVQQRQYSSGSRWCLVLVQVEDRHKNQVLAAPRLPGVHNIKHYINFAPSSMAGAGYGCWDTALHSQTKEVHSTLNTIRQQIQKDLI